MKIDDLLQNEVFENIEPERIDAVKSIIEEVKGKTSNEAMLVVLKHAKTLRAGRKITKEEGDAMMSLIYTSLSPEEQEQFKGIIKLIEKFT